MVETGMEWVLKQTYQVDGISIVAPNDKGC